MTVADPARVPFPWPRGARCALVLSFDFDAESLWLAKGPHMAARLGPLSLGRYGPRVGVPRILELLREEGLKATFFTPGWTADHHRAALEAVVADGHEIAHHGYTHAALDPADEAAIVDEIDGGLEALARNVGVRPRGFRAPDGETCAFLLRLLVARGMVYDSSLKDDVVPYRYRFEDGSAGPVELPEQPTLDDWAFGATSIEAPRPLFPKDHVLAIWQDEFRALYAWGGLVMVVMHPQVTGRPMRLASLREFIAFTRGFPGVWYATASEVAEAFVAAETGAPRR